MTPLNKPVTRMTSAMVRSTGKKKMRRLTATLMPTAVADLLVLRPEGTKKGSEEAIDLLDVWAFAKKQRAKRLVEERKAKRRKS